MSKYKKQLVFSSLLFIVCCFASSFAFTEKAAAACANYFESQTTAADGTVYRTYRLTSQYSGSTAPGTIQIENCSGAAPSYSGYLPTHVQIGSVSANVCVNTADYATGAEGGTNFAKYLDRCANQDSAGYVAQFDDSGIITYPGGYVCFARNDSRCASDAQDYVANSTGVYRPRSFGYLNNLCNSGCTTHTMAPAPGSAISYTVNALGVLQPFNIRFDLKQQYTGGYYGWVALRYTYKPIQTISGRVFNHPTQVASGGLSGVGISVDNNNATAEATTNSSGVFTVSLPKDKLFNVRIVGWSPTAPEGPFIRPWTEGHPGLPPPQCPNGFDSSTASPTVGGNNYCTYRTYEWQVAGVDAKDPALGYPASFNTRDRASNSGFDFVYVTPPPPTCGNVTTSPSSPSAGTPFTVTVSFNNPSSGSAIDSSYQLSIEVSGIYPRTNRPFSNTTDGGATVAPGQTGQATSTPMTTSSPGSYTITYELTNSAGTVVMTCPDTITTPNSPYFRTYGGDTVAGLPANCLGWTTASPSAAITNANIKAFNQGSGNFRGAGAQLAALAQATIDQFASGTLRSASDPDYLTFAHPSSTYGGNFGSAPCPPDYYNQVLGKQGVFSDTGNLHGILNTYKSDPESRYSYISGTNVFTGQATFTIDGDLNVSQNVIYGSWASVDDIPNLVIIVKGNIFINRTVTQVDATLIAQPETIANIPSPANKGYIYTCAAGVSPPNQNFIDSFCNNKLTINGSLVAMGLRLHRTNGTLGNATDNELSNSGNLAESFIFHPAVWLAPCAPGFCVEGSSDGIRGLPPIL